MIADNDARARALDTSISFIVQAPAGSGKTELLIQRYMKLLETVRTPDAVVAITFTRKAAAEMRSRVLEALRGSDAGLQPEAEHQRVTLEIARNVLDCNRRLGWNLLHNPAQMRIETIDALCASITQRMPWLARFGAMPEITEKADDLYREAARNTLRHVEEGHEPLEQILLHLDNDFDQAERLIVRLLARRDQWLRHIGAQSVREELEESLQRQIRRRLEELREAFDPDAAREAARLLALDQTDDLESWKSISGLLLTKNGDWRQRFDKKLGVPADLKLRWEALLAHLRPQTGLRDALHRIRQLPPPQFTDPQWETVQAAVAVMKLAVAELQLVFRSRGRVDFAELAIRASEALGRLDSPTDLALALGCHIRHILVDEFQDTSYTQFALLEKLTVGWEQGDGRTMFLVGDPMQSIYRFREADVSLMLKARQEGIGSIRFEALTLSVNFRSDPEIVTWLNRHFERILPAQDDVELGAVAYSPSVAGASGGKNARVEVHALLDAHSEAERVLELANSSSGKTAILVRTRAHLAAIVPLLKRSRIPFQAVEIDQLGQRPVVEDLMALTFALLHPADRVSWLAILRAPWCGLTLQDLHSLAGSDRASAIWDLLRRPSLGLSPDGAARVLRILPILEDARSERGRRPLREYVESVWRRLGGAELADETALQDASAYFELLEGSEHGADLDDFGWFRAQVNDLFAQPDAQAGDRLQLMTIHKAKGLEFDTVILPGLGERAGSDEQNLLVWLEQGGDLLLAPIAESGHDSDPIYKYLSDLEREKDKYETARLLYVASTRARSNLHLLGSVKLKPDGSATEPVGGTFLSLLWPAAAPVFVNVSRAALAEPLHPQRWIHRVPAGWEAPTPAPAVTFSRPIEALEPPRVAFERAGERLRHAGTALHGFLQRIAREGLESWDEDAIRSRRALYRTVLANLGVAPGELREAAERVETGLLRTLRDPRGRWILEPHAEAECELSLAGLIDGRLAEAVIDRTFIDEQGVRWIIDYKTSDHQGSEIDAFLDNERVRYQEQLERYARLLFQRDHRPIRLALYFPLLGGWREWPAPVVLRKQATLFEL